MKEYDLICVTREQGIRLFNRGTLDHTFSLSLMTKEPEYAERGNDEVSYRYERKAYERFPDLFDKFFKRAGV